MARKARSSRPAVAPTRNRLLAALPPNEYKRLARHLEHVTLELKQVLFDVDTPIEHVYFIETGVASILGVMADGTAVETATVGHEGMIGLPLFHGADRTSSQCFCQIPGEAWRMTASAFRDELARNEKLTVMLHRFSQALLTLIAQSSACNRVHRMEQRLARWLLHCHDRVGSDQFLLRHEFLGQMLGVRRATVTEAVGILQQRGLIQYAMGKITINDRPGLESMVCECYRIITHEFDRLLEGRISPAPLRGLRTAKDGKSTVRELAPKEKKEDDDVNAV